MTSFLLFTESFITICLSFFSSYFVFFSRKEKLLLEVVVFLTSKVSVSWNRMIPEASSLFLKLVITILNYYLNIESCWPQWIQPQQYWWSRLFMTKPLKIIYTYKQSINRRFTYLTQGVNHSKNVCEISKSDFFHFYDFL